ncbi:OmpH family outer membrane protein [Psychroserpens algicola]|uniref:OmpH family outer membrane protein n=1 Tax=Psychroserpens algicola TaxID=1719034 RepID=A0ABT0HDU5_9FLAO|nr:OmpH family outer membrane protein [Psychroserpens algicola]MCK8482229.1 OmpH family outer membrane protein [Psychroserpens algicola]
MNKLKLLPLINTLLIIGLILFYVFNATSNNKESIVYVNNAKLFNEFQMTKEMRTIGEDQMQEKRKILDGLVTNYQSIEDKTSEASQSLQNRIVILNQELQEFQQDYFNSVNQKITDRLDVYLEEFGKAKGLKFILGSNILYVEDTIEVTDEALQYINQRYNGLQLN